MNLLRATNFEFRYRFWVIALLFMASFALYWVDHQNAAVALVIAVARGRTNGDDAFMRRALQIVFGIAAAVVILAAVLRTWAAAYLRSEVVHDLNLHSEALVADGPYRHTRNPLYLGSLLMTIGMGALASRTGWLFMVIGMAIYGCRLIAREESELLASQGHSFRAYCDAVPRLWFAFRPRLPTGQRQPRWMQALVGESIFWLFGAGLLLFAITLRTRYVYVTNCSALGLYTLSMFIWKRRVRQS